MKLLSLTLRNFKGIPDFTFTPNGENASIFGCNFSGKTTLANAWSWLITGKDASGKSATGKSSFEIKRLSNGEAEHGAENEVSAMVRLDDGSEHELKKIFREKWEGKRGAAKTLAGNTVDHYLDGVPVKEKEYLEFLNGIADQQTIQILTNPAYFSASLPWETRRSILLQLCGDITADDAYAENPSLEPLREILAGPPARSVEGLKKIAKSSQTELNRKIDEIPTRISEQKRAIGEAAADPVAAATGLSAQKNVLQDLQSELAIMQSGGAIAEKRKALAEIETKLARIQTEENRKTEEALEAKRKELGAHKFGRGGIQADIDGLNRKIKLNDAEIQAKAIKLACLRDDFATHNKSVWELPPGGDLCPTCGQQMPEDQINSARETFNINRATALEGINSEGKKISESKKLLESENQGYSTAVLEKQKKIDEISVRIEALEAEINAPPESEVNQEVRTLTFHKVAIESEIAALESDPTHASAIEDLNLKIHAAEFEITGFQNTLAQIKAADDARKRIKELEAEHREYAAQLETVQHQIFLCEEFTRAQARLITGNVEKHFEFVGFRLFTELINGEVSPCCETTIHGVPYSGDASTSEKMLAGLDIIRTLGRHWGVNFPVFCDNMESTTSAPEMESQMIKLYVSKDDLTLRIGA